MKRKKKKKGEKERRIRKKERKGNGIILIATTYLMSEICNISQWCAVVCFSGLNGHMF